MNKFLLTSILTVGVAFASEGRTDDTGVTAEDVEQLRQHLAALSEDAPVADSAVDVADTEAAADAVAPESNVSKVMTLDVTEDEFAQRLAEGKKNALERRESVSNFRGLEEDFGSLPEQPTQPGDATRLLQEMASALQSQARTLERLYHNGMIPYAIWEQYEGLAYPARLGSEDLKLYIKQLQEQISKIVLLSADEGIDLRPHLQMTCKKPEAHAEVGMAEAPGAETHLEADGGPAADSELFAAE